MEENFKETELKVLNELNEETDDIILKIYLQDSKKAESPLITTWTNEESGDNPKSSTQSINRPFNAISHTPINLCRRRSSTTTPQIESELNVPIGNIIQKNHPIIEINDQLYNQQSSSLPSIESLTIVDESNSLPPTSFISTATTASFDEKRGDPEKHCYSSSEKMSSPKLDAVSKVTGEWGKWQLRTVFLIFLCKIPSSWFMACIIYTAPAPRHGEFYCKPPPAHPADLQNRTGWIKISHPEKEEADDQEFNIDFCNVYQDAMEHAHQYFHYESASDEPKVWLEPNRNANVVPCTSFEHHADFHSIITQFDLVCSRDILVATTQFFHLFGVLTGGILAAHLLKHFSPRNVMMFGMLAQIFCGNMTGHVVSYELHVFFRCLSAVCCAQMYTAGAMIFCDITGGKYKTTCVCLFEQFWSIGVILLPGVASFFKSWTHLYMAISFPTFILVYLWRWIPDSPRWMLQRGRVQEAKEILMKCTEINGTQSGLPYDIDHQLKLYSIKLIESPPPAGWWSIWKGPKAVRQMICVHLSWSIYIVIYYGMLLNIRTFSRDHLEINTAIAGCCEMIGTFTGLFLILKTENKWQYSGLFNIISGFIAFTAWLIPPEIRGNEKVALLMLSAMVSKTAISCTLSILTTSTIELVTDEKKKICAYSTIVWARIWLLTAPFVGATVIFGQLIPQTAFASLGIIGGILTMCITSPRTHPKCKSNKYQYNENKISATSNCTKASKQLPQDSWPGIWTTKNHDDRFHM